MMYALGISGILGIITGIIILIIWLVKKKKVWLPVTIILASLCCALITTAWGNSKNATYFYNKYTTQKSEYDKLASEMKEKEKKENEIKKAETIEFDPDNKIVFSINNSNAYMANPFFKTFDNEKQIAIIAFLMTKWEKDKYSIFGFCGEEEVVINYENGEIDKLIKHIPKSWNFEQVPNLNKYAKEIELVNNALQKLK